VDRVVADAHFGDDRIALPVVGVRMLRAGSQLVQRNHDATPRFDYRRRADATAAARARWPAVARPYPRLLTERMTRPSAVGE